MRNNQQVTFTDVEAYAKFCAQCVREGVTFVGEERGSVSCATMRPEDLIPAFLSVLEGLDKARHDQIVNDPEFAPWFKDKNAETGDFVLVELFDVLEEYAPEGAYFGASEGDGADFGFFPCE